MVKFALVAHLTVTAAVLSAGCSSDTGRPPTVLTNTAGSQVEALVLRCATTTRNLASAHVATQIRGKFPRIGPVDHVDADVQAKPPLVNGKAVYNDGTVVPFVFADDILSAKLGNEWSELGKTSEFVPAGIVDPSKVAWATLDNAAALQSAGTETIDGVSAFKVTGSVPARRIHEIQPEAAELGGTDFTFTAWIRERGDPVLVRIILNVSADQSVTMSLSNWNVPVSLTLAPTG